MQHIYTKMFAVAKSLYQVNCLFSIFYSVLTCSIFLLGCRESDIMQSPSKIVGASASTTNPAVYGLQGWADLPEGLLHSIIPLLSSFLELHAFAGTCRSWRAAFSSYPSKSRFYALLSPLLVRPPISPCVHLTVTSCTDGRSLI